jgi:uncharacterized protein YecE (DUF72 family)
VEIKVGCCGWGYFSGKQFIGENWKDKFKSVLQAYSSLFSCVEINSTFYRIPKLETAEKWLKEVREINKDFVFTVKCNQTVTHQDQFKTKKSISVFNLMKEVCKKLDASVLLLQCPAGFKATKENIRSFQNFLKNIDRGDLVLTWEPRGKSWTPEIVKEICEKFNLVHCVDPFRNEPLWFGKREIAYFRLHGFGKPSMYNYNFSVEELKQLKEKINALKKIKDFWVFFNNVEMYQNALQFIKILEK